jgi:hypothetical protein
MRPQETGAAGDDGNWLRIVGHRIYLAIAAQVYQQEVGASEE